MGIIEFDTAYSAITGELIPEQYVPAVEHSDAHDVLIDGLAWIDGPGAEWRALTGYTRQHGYRGAVMHPSETLSDEAIREAVRDAGGDVFAVVPVIDTEAQVRGDYECVGWAVIYKEND